MNDDGVVRPSDWDGGVKKAAYRLLDAFDVCDGNRGWLSCVDPHDLRCPKSRADKPEDWKGNWVCECGAEEFAEALTALTVALGGN